MIVMM